MLPSTDSFATFLVNSTGCGAQPTKACAASRGQLFNISRSTSWEALGAYELDLAASQFNYSDPAYGTKNGLRPRCDYGLASVGLGRAPAGVQLTQQVVAAYAAAHLPVGQFGLAPDSTWVPAPHRSFLTTLFNESRIPSLAWGLQAGAAHRARTPAALVLGGWDRARGRV